MKKGQAVKKGRETEKKTANVYFIVIVHLFLFYFISFVFIFLLTDYFIVIVHLFIFYFFVHFYW